MSEKQRHREETSELTDVDLLSLSLRPHYLPREFGQVFVTVLYRPPWACQARAAQQVADTVRELQVLSADASSFVSTTATSVLVYHLLKKTKKQKNIDFPCYGNIPGAFRSFALPPIGNSDHNTVHLVHAY